MPPMLYDYDSSALCDPAKSAIYGNCLFGGFLRITLLYGVCNSFLTTFFVTPSPFF